MCEGAARTTALALGLYDSPAVDGRRADIREHMLHTGFLTPQSTLTDDELYEWCSEVLNEIVMMAQPATYTPETTARTIHGLFDLREADHPMTRMMQPDDFVLAGRVQLAIGSVCTALHATLPAKSIADDLDGVAELITELGKLHHAWVRDRGLPSAFDQHDHP